MRWVYDAARASYALPEFQNCGSLTFSMLIFIVTRWTSSLARITAQPLVLSSVGNLGSIDATARCIAKLLW
jgi:hypothetical protein